ncbi:hypothetical protein R3W88_017864 [Solanum pinnatisectum]|uniref:Uncharacterized protein n=1 Tax=Solanum pinnatisectum TaxID=50273 RepID=A0AAV9L1R0_9SOLN|nr:hypothetical protein R3W88_017864 [Solanum pinnatisectum]
MKVTITTKVFLILILILITFLDLVPFLVVGTIVLVGTTVLIVLAVRTTVITWIMVLVLLAFTGKRRRDVVKDGKSITSEVAMYAANVVFKERRLFAFTGTAIILGFTSMAIYFNHDI